MTQPYGEIIKNFMRTGAIDTKGREIGFAVVFRDNGTDFRAYVQNTRLIKGEWHEFGAPQKSKSFTSQDQANRWAYATAKERIAKAQERYNTKAEPCNS
jgi:hypothetical protein